MWLIIDKPTGQVHVACVNVPTDLGEETFGNPETGLTYASSYVLNAPSVVSWDVFDPTPWRYDPPTGQLKPYIAPSPYPDKTFGEFQDLCYNIMDGGALGRYLLPEGNLSAQFAAGGDRYGDIVAAVETAGASGGLGKSAWERYQGARSSGFKYDTTYVFLGLLVDLTILQEEEFNAIMGSWNGVPE